MQVWAHADVPVASYASPVPGSDNYIQAVLSWELGWYGEVSLALDPGCNATDAHGQALAAFAPFNFTIVRTALVRWENSDYASLQVVASAEWDAKPAMLVWWYS